jgi:hypothetical protein
VACVCAPDLYASANFSNPRPSAARFDKASTAGLGQTDAVVFLWTDLSVCEATFFIQNAQDCELYAGVYGYTDASFSIVASVVGNTTAPVLLLDGQPQVGVVPRGLYRQYLALASASPGSPVYFFFAATAGIVNVFVTLDGRTPTQRSYDYISAAGYLALFPERAPCNSSCVVRAAVLGVTGAQFSITFATPSAVVQLTPGLTFRGVVYQASPAYFFFSREFREQ